MRKELSRQEQREWKDWQDLCDRIRTQTGVPHQESATEKEARVTELRTDLVKFAKYYFPHYLDCDFGWFHKKAARILTDDPNAFLIAEWPREHAKSVFFDIMVPLFLYARGEMTGMLLGSQTEQKAKVLLGDVQAEFEANQRFIHDYGYLVPIGDWRDGHFTTTDGIGFWAFGRGQSPRGTRKGANRPNYGVIDDIDDKVIVRNLQRVRDAVDWVLEDFYGALTIGRSRLVVAGNRIHKHAILAHLVGDVEPEDPKRQGIHHLKVFAIEKGRGHRKGDIADPDSRPAWPRYTKQVLQERFEKAGYRSSRREYFHEHHEEGFVFQNEWIQWGAPLKDQQYDDLVVYCDPSFKGAKDNDYKAVVLLGLAETRIHILWAWVRQASVAAMVGVFYDLYERLENHARYYMEANFVQDLLLDDFTAEGERRGYQLPIRGDKRSKPDKYTRIENLSPLFERGLVYFNERERQSPDMQTLVNQFLGFPFGHDDGPDAVEGGAHYLKRRARASGFAPRSGKFARTSRRI